MVNIETGRVVDLLESRETEAVAQWLREYPNIQYVSRDGSQTYAKAIALAHPQACQISDRFHILKNLNDAVIAHFHKLFKGRVLIPLTQATADIKSAILDAPSTREKIILVKKLFAEGRSRSEIKSIPRIAHLKQ